MSTNNIDNYEIRIIVAGSRNYNDYEHFSSVIFTEVLLKYKNNKVIFITGAAKTGADDLIIQWCKINNYPYKEYPADWDNIDVPGAVIRTNKFGKKYNAIAGHMRNAAMAEVGNRLICLWDGHSSGTKNMIELAKKKNMPITIQIVEINKNKEFTFFHGKEDPLSQWYIANFTINSIEFNCCEQYMMYSKAMLFNDEKIAEDILFTTNPKEQKELGRKVTNFNNEIWKQHREEIIFIGNLNKFQQNLSLGKYLIDTEDTEIVEASKYDSIYGVGLSASNPLINDRKNWKGLNLLGKALMKVRKYLKGI